MDVKFGACQSWGVCLICCGVQAIFYHKIFHTKSPTAPIWTIFNGKESKTSLQQNWKKTAELMVLYEDLSHFPMELPLKGLHAPCVPNPLYLSTQSDPLKTGHILGYLWMPATIWYKIVSIGWGGCAWLPSECKQSLLVFLAGKLPIMRHIQCISTLLAIPLYIVCQSHANRCVCVCVCVPFPVNRSLCVCVCVCICVCVSVRMYVTGVLSSRHD
jgi:hypothetical protein